MWKMKGLGKWEEVEPVEMIDMLAGVGVGEPGFAGRLTHGPDQPELVLACFIIYLAELLALTMGGTGCHPESSRYFRILLS